MIAEFVKQGEILVPANQVSFDWLFKKKNGTGLRGEFKEIRNYEFHKKYFDLLRYAYDHWEPGEINSKYGQAAKTFERFRKDIAILSGFYTVEIRLNREPRIEAKSISFARMNAENFEILYSNTIDIILQRILQNYTRNDIDNVVRQVISYG